MTDPSCKECRFWKPRRWTGYKLLEHERKDAAEMGWCTRHVVPESRTLFEAKLPFREHPEKHDASRLDGFERPNQLVLVGASTAEDFSCYEFEGRFSAP